MSRIARQKTVFDWVRRAFGVATTTIEERVLRFIEEAVELAQAEGLPRDRIYKIVEHVYAKPAGFAAQEVGGVGVTLLAYCEAAGIDADEEEQREVDRVLAVPVEKFRVRHNIKAAAGIAVPAVADEGEP